MNKIITDLYACLHPKEHMSSEANCGWAKTIANMIDGRQKFVWSVFAHCPVCTICGIYYYFKGVFE